MPDNGCFKLETQNSRGGSGLVRIEQLTKRFGSTLAVDNLNLTISKGEFFTIIGPNGAGKTTTLKLVAGLLRPTAGMVYVNGYDMAVKAMEAKKIISFIPDVPYVYDKLTGREFLWFIGELYKMDKNYYEEKQNISLIYFTWKITAISSWRVTLMG